MVSRLMFGLLFGALLCHYAESARWAVLVAGSNGWYNYRHQSDVCHAYQILKQGIPAENIITLMYDDIAKNPSNPNKGVIINKPGGSDVYKGVPIDYSGDDVNPDTFISILKGEKSALSGVGTGRVLESTEEDTVFINFVDHGGTNLLAFPNDYLYSDVLNGALTYMTQKKMFKELIFYVEACESGSMFEGLLPTNTKIYVNTAANADESSYACYYDDQLGTFLGDEFSVNWMENTDAVIAAGKTATVTLQDQYQEVKTATTDSHVMTYGDTSLSTDTLAYVFGIESSSKASPRLYMPRKTRKDSIPSRDTPLHILRKAAEKKKEFRPKYEAAVKGRHSIDEVISKIMKKVTKGSHSAHSSKVTLKKEDYDCYRNLINEFNKQCVNTFKNTYAIKHFSQFAKICASSSLSEYEAVKAMAEVCNDSHRALDSVL